MIRVLRRDHAVKGGHFLFGAVSEVQQIHLIRTGDRRIGSVRVVLFSEKDQVRLVIEAISADRPIKLIRERCEFIQTAFGKARLNMIRLQKGERSAPVCAPFCAGKRSAGSKDEAAEGQQSQKQSQNMEAGWPVGRVQFHICIPQNREL